MLHAFLERINQLGNQTAERVIQLTEGFSWAKLAYSVFLIGVAIMLLNEVRRLWFDTQLYVGRLEFFEDGEENPAQGKSLALQLLQQHRILVHLFAQENLRRQLATSTHTRQATLRNNFNPARDQGQENTWWPHEISPVNNPRTVLDNLELSLQGVNVKQLLSQLRQWISQPNEITGVFDKNGDNIRGTLIWNKGPERIKDRVVEGRVMHIDGQISQSKAALHLACNLIWSQSVRAQNSLVSIARKDFCGWAESWVSYYYLREKSSSRDSLTDGDIETIKQLIAYLSGLIDHKTTYPEVYRLRADFIDLLPNTKRTEELLSLAQKDRTTYALLIDPSLSTPTDGSAKFKAIAIARPAIPLEGGKLSDTLSSTWQSLVQPYQAHIEGAAKATGKITIFNKDGSHRSSATGFVVAPGIIATVDFVLPEEMLSSKNRYPRPFDMGLKGVFSFNENLSQTHTDKEPIPIEEVLYAPGPASEVHFALFRIASFNPTAHPPLVLAQERRTDEYYIGRYVFSIGYPILQEKLPQAFQEALLGNQQNIKRFLPGRIVSIGNTKMANATKEGSRDFSPGVREITSDLSTTAGTAGAPLIDLESGQVIGIHYGGVWSEGKGKFAFACMAADIIALTNFPRSIFATEQDLTNEKKHQ